MEHKTQQTRKVNIAAIERDTGIAKDTLRVWERRYGFPNPTRDQFGERVYSAAQFEKLRLIKRLLDAGHRPGKTVPLTNMQLRRSIAGLETAKPSSAPAVDDAMSADLSILLGLVKAHRVDDLRQALVQCLIRLGIGRFVMEVVAPLNQRVGEAWLKGNMEVFEEHLYTEVVAGVLRNAINSIPVPSTDESTPHILLTTFPNESHGLGILMAEAIFTLESCHCTSLGTQTPIADIVRAAQARQTDIVALSFTAVLKVNHVLAGLSELRRQLPANIQIWAGGASPVLRSKRGISADHVLSLQSIAAQLKHWRTQHN